MNPARMFLESFDRRPGIREQPGSSSDLGLRPSLVRSSLNNGHAGAVASCPFGADIVAKVFFGGGTQILRPVDAAIE